MGKKYVIQLIRQLHSDYMHYRNGNEKSLLFQYGYGIIGTIFTPTEMGMRHHYYSNMDMEFMALILIPRLFSKLERHY